MIDEHFINVYFKSEYLLSLRNKRRLRVDPSLSYQVENIRDGLIKVDPKNAMYYKNNAQNFIGQLKSLDMAIKEVIFLGSTVRKEIL